MIRTWYMGNETLMLLKNENKEILSIEHIGIMGVVSLILGFCSAVIVQMLYDVKFYIGMENPISEHFWSIVWQSFCYAGGLFLVLMVVAIIKKIRFTLAIRRFEKQLEQFRPRRFVPDSKCERKFECQKIGQECQKIGHECQRTF